MSEAIIITKGPFELSLHMKTPTSGYVKLKNIKYYSHEIGYQAKLWHFKETANKFRIWAPYDVAGAIIAGMTQFEIWLQKKFDETENYTLIYKTTEEIAAQFREVYQLTKTND